MDTLKTHRQQASLALPHLLADLSTLRLVPDGEKREEEERIKALFPHISGQAVLKGHQGEGALLSLFGWVLSFRGTGGRGAQRPIRDS